MKTLMRGAAVGLALALSAQVAQAQAGLSLGLGAGAVVPTGSMADLNSTGWTGQASLRVKPAVSPLGFQVDAFYSRLGLENDIEGHSRVRRAGPIVLDNVHIDNIGPPNVYAEYADIEIAEGGANFRPGGTDVNLVDNTEGTTAPHECVFPRLPAPELPEGWLRE